MLGNSSDFGVDSLNGCAGVRGETNLASIPLQRAVDQSANLALDITSRLGIGERTVGSSQLETCGVLDETSGRVLESGRQAGLQRFFQAPVGRLHSQAARKQHQRSRRGCRL